MLMWAGAGSGCEAGCHLPWMSCTHGKRCSSFHGDTGTCNVHVVSGVLCVGGWAPWILGPRLPTRALWWQHCEHLDHHLESIGEGWHGKGAPPCCPASSKACCGCLICCVKSGFTRLSGPGSFKANTN